MLRGPTPEKVAHLRRDSGGGEPHAGRAGHVQIAAILRRCKPLGVEGCEDQGTTRGLDSPGGRAARTIIRRLREAGHVALLAGGCVRDRLLGVEPGDWDIATSAAPEEVQRLFARTVPVGARFGVVLVLAGGAEVEVATFRTDGPYLDGRRPTTVGPSDARGDAARRDFTINGMFLDPESGEIIDYVGGQRDLAARVIRAIGDPAERFGEDRLRLLRAVRFAARFEAEIEPRTLAAIRVAAAHVTEVAWERIGEEIVRILLQGRAPRAFELLSSTGLLAAVLPEIATMRDVAQSPRWHPEGDVFAHTLRCLAGLDGARHDEALALGVLLHDAGKPETASVGDDGRVHFYGHEVIGETLTRSVCRRLRRSLATEDRAAWLVRHHLRHRSAPEMKRSTLRRMLAAPDIHALLELARIDALAGSGDLSTVDFCQSELAALGEEGRRLEPLLRGRDLLALGYRPGPRLGRILERVLDEQLEGRLASRTEARAWVLAALPPDSGESA